MAYLQDKDLFVLDAWGGTDPKYKMPIRVVNEFAWHNLFARNMKVQRQRVSRFLTDSVPLWEPSCYSRSSFYREEFIKCQRCLDQQREYYSESAVTDVEEALTKVMAQLDRLCANEDADQVVSRLLRQFDVVTGLSAWTDPRQVN